MNKERLTGVFVIFGAVVIALVGFLFSLIFSFEILLIYLTFIFSIISLGYLILYLKIQHNLEKKYSGLKYQINKEIFYRLDEQKNYLEEGFNKQKNYLEEVVDFLESLLKYLETEKVDRLEGFEDIKKEIYDGFLEQKEMQKKMASGVEDLFNTQYEQVKSIEKRWKEFADSKKKSSGKK